MPYPNHIAPAYNWAQLVPTYGYDKPLKFQIPITRPTTQSQALSGSTHNYKGNKYSLKHLRLNPRLIPQITDSNKATHAKAYYKEGYKPKLRIWPPQ